MASDSEQQEKMKREENEVEEEEQQVERKAHESDAAEDEGSKKATKEMIFAKLREILDASSDVDLEKLSVKSIREDLARVFGDAVNEHKAEIKQEISMRFMRQVEEKEKQKVDNDEGVDDEDEESSSEEEESDVDDDPVVAALPEEWKAEFESVIWVKTSKQFPWWPAIVYNPTALKKRIKTMAMKNLGKKHAVYYYGSAQWDFALPKQMKPFSENIEEFCKQKISKRYTDSFDKGVALAKLDIELPKEERASWNHTIKLKSKSKSRKKKVEPKPTKSTSKALSKPPKKKDINQTKAKRKNDSLKGNKSKVDVKAQDEEREDSEEEKEFSEADEGGSDDNYSDGDGNDDDYVEEEKKPKKKSSSEKSSHKRKPSKDIDDSSPKKKKKKKKEISDEEKEKRKKSKLEQKEANKESKKRKASSESGSLSGGMKKKKLIEEKNALEKSRIEKMKNNSSEPVWKQARASQSQSSAAPESSKKSSIPSGVSRPVETPVERAKRLCQLIEVRIKNEEKKVSEGGSFETAHILKIMRKAKSLELSLAEWAESKFIELINTLRKYSSSSEIASEAKEIRSHLKSKMTALAAHSSSSSSSSENGSIKPVAATESSASLEKTSKEEVSQTPSSAPADTDEKLSEKPQLVPALSADKEEKEKMVSEPVADDDNGDTQSSRENAKVTKTKLGDKCKDILQLGIEIIADGYSSSRTEEGTSSDQSVKKAARRIVACLERCCGTEDVSKFISAVQKFAFGLKSVVDDVGDDLSALAAKLESREEIVSRLADRPVSEWKTVLNE